MIAFVNASKLAALTVGAASLALSIASPSLAGTLTYTGTTNGGPTWNRPLGGNPPTVLSGVGTATPYNVFGFTVNATGLYDFLSNATDPLGWDNYLFLYSNSFNPVDQFTNVIVGNDDFPSIGASGFNGVNLTTGINYFLVTSGFGNADVGAFSNSISGVGDIASSSSTPVPTPALLPGIIGMGAAAYRKRKGVATAKA
jgi:hypothetical protein